LGKYTWLPRALSYFADEEVKNYGMIDRIANSINPNVALTALYDALRNLLTIVNSSDVKEKYKFVSKFGKVETIEGVPHYCFEGNCPSVCKKENDKCCCDPKALYELAKKEADDLKHKIKDFDIDAILELKVIAINALG